MTLTPDYTDEEWRGHVMNALRKIEPGLHYEQGTLTLQFNSLCILVHEALMLARDYAQAQGVIGLIGMLAYPAQSRRHPRKPKAKKRKPR